MKTILLIEDDKVLRENTKELLELSGFMVIVAPNGRIGIEFAKERIPDLIVCDIMMPEIDGYGVLQELSSAEVTNQIPFIFLSAKTEHKEIRKGMDLGADDYLTKPFEEEDLLSAIASRLAKTELVARMGAGESLSGPAHNDEMKTLNELKNFFDDNGEIETYGEGQMVFHEGTHSHKIYLILKGVVKCHTIDEDGKELITSLHRADDFLGLSSFVQNSPYPETATALETVELAGISKEQLKDIVSKNQSISLELMGLLTENLTEMKSQLLQMAYGSVRRKTAQTVLQFAEILNKNNEEPIKISRNDLASVAGIATESLIRTLSGFKKEGLIAIEGRNIKILKLKALKHII